MKTRTLTALTIASLAGAAASLAVLLRRRPAEPADLEEPQAKTPVELDPVPKHLRVHPGLEGLASVDVPFLVGALVSASAIRDGLRAKGLSPLLVTEERPPWWPGREADWYIRARFVGRQGRTLDVPGAVERLWLLLTP